MRKFLIYLILLLISNSNIAQGVLLDLEDFEKAKTQFESSGTVRSILPSRKTLEKYLPYADAYNQGSSSMCLAYSAAICRTILYAKNKNITTKKDITNNGFSPLYIYYNNTYNDYSCINGLRIYPTLNWILENGFVKYEDVEYPKYYPYSNLRSNCSDYPYSNQIDLANGKNYKLDAIWKIENINQLKYHLANDMPITAFLEFPGHLDQVGGNGSIFWDRTKSVRCYGVTKQKVRCRNMTKNKEGFCHLHKGQTPEMGHCVTVVGYDDNKYGGSVLILNSAGSNWGLNGLIWMNYTDFISSCALHLS